MLPLDARRRNMSQKFQCCFHHFISLSSCPFTFVPDSTECYKSNHRIFHSLPLCAYDFHIWFSEPSYPLFVIALATLWEALFIGALARPLVRLFVTRELKIVKSHEWNHILQRFHTSPIDTSQTQTRLAMAISSNRVVTDMALVISHWPLAISHWLLAIRVVTC